MTRKSCKKNNNNNKNKRSSHPFSASLTGLIMFDRGSLSLSLWWEQRGKPQRKITTTKWFRIVTEPPTASFYGSVDPLEGSTWKSTRATRARAIQILINQYSPPPGRWWFLKKTSDPLPHPPKKTKQKKNMMKRDRTQPATKSSSWWTLIIIMHGRQSKYIFF